MKLFHLDSFRITNYELRIMNYELTNNRQPKTDNRQPTTDNRQPYKPMYKYILFLLLLTLSSVSVLSQEDDKQASDDSNKYNLKNLTANSYDSDFGVTYYGENKILFSSTRKDDENNRKKWKGNDQRFLNFYVGETNELGEIISYESLKGEGNTRFHESNATFNRAKTKVYFTRNTYYKNKKRLSKDRKMKLSIYIADVDAEGKWFNIVPFPYNSTEYSNGHPTLSLDEKTMYFTSDMPGGMGRTDIFKVSIKETGTFTYPENLGGNVNTPGREMFPFIAADGTLYFSSDFHEGLGKLDIFKTDSDELELAAIQNLGAPFNSRRDDFCYVLNDNLMEGYFSSNRTGGKGDDDIYSFKYGAVQKQEEKETVVVDVDCTSLISGVVTNAKDKTPIKGATVEITDTKGAILYKEKVGVDGHFSFETSCATAFTVSANKPLYLPNSVYVKTSDVVGQETLVNIELISEVKKRDGKIIIDIESIYFDYDSDVITKRAATELEKVVAFMYKYPNVIIEGGSHTDARGPHAYNLKLSQRRAKSTVRFIINNGISDPGRIYAMGFGETQPVNRCVDGVKPRCVESEHALNRRTEFVIVNPDVFED